MIDGVKAVALAAAAAGAEVLRRFDPLALDVRDKRPFDLVTAADLAAERAIVSVIRSAFPDDGLLLEEGGAISGGRRRWVVDPLDGTTNFAHGVPHCAVSIGVEDELGVLVGVVHDVFRGEVFSATRGGGAWHGGQRIAVSGADALEASLVATGFPTGSSRSNFDHGPLQRVLPHVRCVRRNGSAALDLAWVACGRFGAYWEGGLKPWDTSAGMLLVREAGGVVSDRSGGPFTPGDPWIVASNGRVHQALLDLIGPDDA
jgi:myo-inositol-1(or 4)-monophosphatase